jgi:dihydrofolate reductase
MRRLVYSVATSLDGFIAGPHGEYDWIVPDPTFDFSALWNQFDTLLMGRRTYEVALTRFESIEKMGKKVVVVSTRLDPAQHPGVTVLADNIPPAVSALKAESGRDVWLMGGGVLFRTLLDAGLVDTIQLTVIPVLLGSGVPLLPESRQHRLQLTAYKAYPNGTLALTYSASPQTRAPARITQPSDRPRAGTTVQKKKRKP